MSHLVIYEEKNDIGIITLNNPEKRNALTKEMIDTIRKHLERVGEEKKVKVVILRGEGKGFCSGHYYEDVLQEGIKDVFEVFNECGKMFRTLKEIPQVTIASVHGFAAGAGCQLVGACDLAVAEEGTLFMTPGIKFGFFCATPGVYVSRNLSRKRAAEMLFTGEPITAEKAYEWGLVNRVAPKGKLMEVTLELASLVTRFSLNVISLGKRLFHSQLDMSEIEALEYATNLIVVNAKMEDAKEGIKAFLEKRDPVWKER
ncbi:MAG: enoyl-CoA hydratase-related protein [Thermosulfidibacteraceae bacterium]|jgi:enoyl-CoA hydratase/carnithine racemase